MKPFKPRSYRKRLITYKRLFYATLIVFMGYLWYEVSDEVVVNKNDKQTSEVHKWQMKP